MIICIHLQSLWTEKSALQDIVCEMAEVAPSLETSTGGNKKLSRAKVFREAITFSKLHYTDDIEVKYPIDAIDFLERKNFDVDYVLHNVDHIRDLIDVENAELERSISDLQKIINGEELHPSNDTSPRSSRDQSITISAISSSNSKKSHHPIADTKLFSQTVSASSGFIKSKDPRSTNSGNHNNIISTKTMQKSASMPSDVSFFSEIEENNHQYIESTGSNNQSKSSETSPITPPTRTRGSKFRERLRDAQAELFLADDI